MGEEGDILYFDPFYFKNGNTSKPKYFIVLKIMDGQSLLASLPSSLDYRPAQSPTGYGCIEIPEACFNCFLFKAGHSITIGHWAFPLDTYLYGQQIDEYDISVLRDIYPVEGLDFKIIGRLRDQVFDSLKACFIKSANVKRKFRRLLSQS